MEMGAVNEEAEEVSQIQIMIFFYFILNVMDSLWTLLSRQVTKSNLEISS